jgi:hypothetical protein
MVQKIKQSSLYFFLSVVKSGILYYYYFFRNQNVTFFDYKKLCKNYPVFSLSKNPGKIGNKCYGNLWAVMNALKSEFDEKCVIEHGLYFGEYVLLYDLQLEKPNVIYTYGDYRKKVLENCKHECLKNVKIKSVGPYINFVSNFSSPETIKEIKQKYGKVLLVFPTHASPEVSIKYNHEEFIDEVKEIAQDYDTVFISLFWLDILKNMHLQYEKLGFTVVSAGTRNDPRFLRRLKDLIDISAMTMSNDIGTHIGYCISLNKPHYYYYQDINKIVIQKNFCFDDEVRISIIEKEKKLFSEIFNSKERIITNEQRKIVEHYWGKK